MNIEKTVDSKYTIRTEKEEKSFTSQEEAKMYLKEIGMSDSQINDLFHKSSITNVTRKTSFSIGKQSISIPSFNRCSYCKKEIKITQKRCPFCFREIKKPFWKKILGIA